MSLPSKRTEGDCGSSHDESDDTTLTAVDKAARDLEEIEPPKILSNASDADVSNSSDSIPLYSLVTETSSNLPRSPRKTKRKSKPDSSERECSSEERETKCSHNTPKKSKHENKDLDLFGFMVRIDSKRSVVAKDDSSSEKRESDTTGNKAIGSKLFKCSDVKSDEENSSDVSINIGALRESHEKDKITKFGTTDIVTIKTKKEVCDTIEVAFTEVNVGNLISAAVSNTMHKEERSPCSGISETTKHAFDPKTCFEEVSQTVDLVRTVHSGNYTSSNEIMEIGSGYSAMETGSECSAMEIGSEYSAMETGSEHNNESAMETNTDTEKMDYSSESRTGFESGVKSTETEGMECSGESALAESDSIRGHENVSISNEVPIELNIDNSLKLERESLILRLSVKNEPDDDSKPEREPSTPSVLGNKYVMSNESESNRNEVESVDDSNSNKTIDIKRELSIPHIETSHTDEYEYDQNKDVIKDKDSIIVSAKLTSDAKKLVAEKAPLIIAKEPSKIDDEQSSKRKRSIDSDNGIEG